MDNSCCAARYPPMKLAPRLPSVFEREMGGAEINEEERARGEWRDGAPGIISCITKIQKGGSQRKQGRAKALFTQKHICWLLVIQRCHTSGPQPCHVECTSLSQTSSLWQQYQQSNVLLQEDGDLYGNSAGKPIWTLKVNIVFVWHNILITVPELGSTMEVKRRHELQ